MNRWLTPKQAAELLPYSEQYIRRLLRTGKMPGKKFGKLWAIDIKEVLGGNSGNN